MIGKKIISISTIFLLISLIFPIQNIYGHGWGLDTTNIDFNGRIISVSFELPQYFDEAEEKIIQINAFDEKLKENAKNVTFLIGLSHEGKTIFRNYFFTPDGNLSIHVKPIEDGDTKINAEKDSLLGAWYATESNPIELITPIFNSGGLFQFEIELRTIDEPNNIVENLGTYNADVSIAETTVHPQKDKENNNVNFRIKSYFDKISSFNFDPEQNIVTFQIPFDWDENVISHIPVVHEEVHFPKNFVDFLTPGYSGKINGVELFKSNVIIDDFTDEGERIVHFVILQDHLKYLLQEQKKGEGEIPKFMEFTLGVTQEIEFPMTAMTRNEQFQIDLSWEPIEIEPGKKTKFIFTVRDPATGNTLRQSSYNFVILQNNEEVYRTSGVAQIGGDSKDYVFKESQTGPTIIRFENIRDSGLDTEFGLVVVPEFGIYAILTLVLAISSMVFLSHKFGKIPLN